MDKYIVEIDGKNIFLDADGKNKLALSVKADNGYAVFCTEIPLTPYTEPDLEQVRKEAYDKCMDEAEMLAYKLYSPKIDGAYQRGLNDAWDAARKICHMDSKTRDEIFDRVITSNIVDENTASEAIEKIRQYEQPVTTEDVMRQYLDTFCSKCKGCGACILNTPDFTCGRGYHFLTDNRISDEEVRRAYAEVLQKVK